MTSDAIRQSVQDLSAKFKEMNVTSLHDKAVKTYSNKMLNELTTALNQHDEEVDLANAFQTLLTENWTVVNGTALAYTTLLANDITALLLEIAQFVANKKNLVPVEVLMPGISLVSYHKDYDNIDAETNLQTLLKTHILGGNSGAYLLPVKLITELDLSAASIQLGNPYFDVFNPVGNGFVDAEEYKRLVTHSALTQAVFDTKQEYELLTNDTNNLLGQLKQLCRQLGVNSVGNLGTEENAGTGAYPAIINFMEYYNRLDNIEKNKIPAELRTEINTLLTLVTDKTQNINATENYDTCIATRRNQLIDTMGGHDTMLNQISLSSNRKASLIYEAQIHFETAKAALAEAIDKNTYAEGHDHLNLNIRLLTELNVQPSIQSIADLDIIKALNPAEITSIFTDAKIRQQLIEQLRHLDNLVLFIMDMPAEKLLSFLQANSEELFSAFIKSPRYLSGLLISLNIEKCTIILDTFADKLTQIIKSWSDFKATLLHLSPEQCRLICNAFQDRLLNIIPSAAHLGEILRELTLEQCIAICEAMKYTLPRIIRSGTNLGLVLRFLSEDKRTAVYEVMRNQWQCIALSNIADITTVLQYLTFVQRTAVIDIISDKLSDIITSITDLNNILQYLTPMHCISVCKIISNKFPPIINSVADLNNVLHELIPEKREAVCDGFKNRLPVIINSTSELISVMQKLTKKQSKELSGVIKNRLPNLIRSSEDFISVQKYLTSRHQATLFDDIRGRLSGFIRSGEELGRLMLHLNTEQRTAMFDIMQDKFSYILLSNHDLFCLMLALTPQQCTTVCKVIKDRLDIISSGSDLKNVLWPLNLKQRTAVYDVMLDKLPNIIKSGTDLAQVLQYLTPEQCKAVCDNLNLADIIKSYSDFQIILSHLKQNQRNVLFDAISDLLPDLIKKSDAYIFKQLRHLTSDQKSTIMATKKLMDSFLNIASDQDVTALASALTSDNLPRIKAKFELLIAHSNTTDTLITALSGIEPCWLVKINKASELKLTTRQLTCQSAVKTGIERYVTSITNKKGYKRKIAETDHVSFFGAPSKKQYLDSEKQEPNTPDQRLNASSH